MSEYHLAVLLIFSHSVFAEVAITRVDVFVDDLSPIAAGAEAQALERSGVLMLWNLDDLERFNTRMAQDLPRDLASAKQRLAERIQSMAPDDVAELTRAATGSARAEGFHVTRLPAVLINEQHLYYGPRNIEAALQAYKADPQAAKPPVPAQQAPLEPTQ